MMLDVRTTITIDDDILEAAKELAAMQRRTLGEIISELARRSLSPPPAHPRLRNGVPLLSARPATVRVTSELIRRLEEDLP